MMSRKNRVRQIIKAPITVMTFIALTGGFRVIKAALDDVCGRTRWTRDAVWPAQIADGLITLHLIDQIFDVDLQRWTPVRGWDMGGHQYTTSSHATTLESNKSVTALYELGVDLTLTGIEQCPLGGPSGRRHWTV